MAMISNRDAIEVELVCQVKDQTAWKKFVPSLEGHGVSVLSDDFTTQSVHLRLHLLDKSIIDFQKDIESTTGVPIVIKGVGSKVCTVCEFSGTEGVTGVVRVSQLESFRCLVDGVIDGLYSGRRSSLTLHPYGDLSGDCFENLGEVEKTLKEDLHPENGVSSFHFTCQHCDVASMIGKSMAVTQEVPGSLTGKVLAAGIIARSSTVGVNTKKICTCSGKSIWEEKKDIEAAQRNQSEQTLNQSKMRQ